MKRQVSELYGGKKKGTGSFPNFDELIPCATRDESLVYVPWFNQKEWFDVREKLYSQNITDMQWAVGRISAWNSKSGSSMSAGAVCTADLCRAKIQDILRQQGTTQCEQNEICMLYGMAVIRFINLVSDLGKTSKGGFRLDIAESLNIPSWIVQLRNDVSHGNMPSYERLKRAVDISFEWLKLNYWIKEEKNLMDYTKGCVVKCTDIGDEETIIREYLRNFQTYHFEFIYNRHKKTRYDIYFKLTQLAYMYKLNPERFTNILTEPGFLILRYHHLDAILKSEEKDYLDNDSISLPRMLERFWIPVLEIYNSNPETYNQLIISLLRPYEDELHQRVAASWAMRFLDIAVTSEKCDLKVPSYLRWKEFLIYSLKNPTKFSPSILKVIAEKVQINPAMKNCLMALVAIQLGTLVDERKLNSSPAKKKSSKKNIEKFYSLEDLKNQMKKRLKSQDTIDLVKGPWRVSEEDVNWSEYPLGITPENVVNNQSFEVEKEIKLEIVEIVEENESNFTEVDFKEAEQEMLQEDDDAYDEHYGHNESAMETFEASKSLIIF